MKKIYLVLVTFFFFSLSSCAKGVEIKEVIPQLVNAGGVVIIKGSGFTPNEPLRVDFNGHLGRGSGEADSAGNFSLRASVPYFPRGVVGFFIIGLQSYKFARGTVCIKPHVEAISPQRGVIGSLVNIRGTGFNSNETVIINFGTYYTLATSYSLSNGNVVSSVYVPHLSGGIKEISLLGLVSKEEVVGTFSIIPSIYKVEPRGVRVNSIVEIEGRGYLPKEEVVLNFGDLEKIATATERGDVVISFLVMTQPFGRKTLTVRGIKSESLYLTDLFIRGDIVVYPASGRVGTPVRVKGAGFGAGERIQLALGTIINLAFTYADKEGNFALSFSTPKHHGGKLLLAVFGISSYESVREEFTLLPSLEIKPSEGLAGSNLTIIGEGYFAEDTIAMDFGDITTYTTLTTTSGGYFSQILPAPSNLPLGTYSIIGRSINSPNWQATATFHLLPNFLLPQPTSGGIGDEIKLHGIGWAPQEFINISFSSPYLQPLKVITNSEGNFITQFTVATQPQQEIRISAVGETSNIKKEVRFQIKPKINYISCKEGRIGDEISIFVSGFLSEELLTLYLGDVFLKRDKASELGTWSTTFKIPENIEKKEVELWIEGLPSRSRTSLLFNIIE